MAQTAVNQLQEQIEAIRREAFAAGYAAAMQAIREFVAKPAPGAAPAAAPRRRGRPRLATTAAPPPAPSLPAPSLPARTRQSRAAARPAQRAGRASAKRPQRGTNAHLVEEVLQSNAPRALRPSEIRKAVQRDKGVAMAFTSIRHALGQLEERRAAEQVGDSKTWRYRANAISA